MRGVVGPFLTTGVALATAGVVVANPIKAPSADVQIPAVQLSAGSNDAVSMLDQDFLDAIDSEPSRSTNPLTLLRDLISTLAADATHVGKNAILEAFVAGVTAVSEPELTAVTVPFAPVPEASAPTFPALDTPAAQVFLVPGLDMTSIEAALDIPQPDWKSLVPDSTAIVASIGPAVEQLVRATITDVTYVGGELLAAAFAAGAAVAAEPVLIAKTVIALVQGDFQGALDNAVQAVVAPFEAPGIIVNAVQTVIERRLTELSGNPVPLRPVLSSGAEQADPAQTAPEESADVAEPAETPSTSGPEVRLSGRSAQTEAGRITGEITETSAETTAGITQTATEMAVAETAVTPVEVAADTTAATPNASADTSAATIGASQLRADTAAAAGTASSATDSATGAGAAGGQPSAERAAPTPRRGFGLSRSAAAAVAPASAAAAGPATSASPTAERAAGGARSATADSADSGRN